MSKTNRKANNKYIGANGTRRGNPASASKTPTKGEGKKSSPTIEQFVAAGYAADKYPPEGFDLVESPGLKAYRETGTVPPELVEVERKKRQAKAEAEAKKEAAKRQQQQQPSAPKKE